MNRTSIRILTVFRSTIELWRLKKGIFFSKGENRLGEKRFELSKACSYWVYSSARLTNDGILLLYYFFFLWGLLIFINPVQFPLHEPYFDLTPIRVTHTKIIRRNIITLFSNEGRSTNNQTYCTYSFQRLTSG